MTAVVACIAVWKFFPTICRILGAKFEIFAHIASWLPSNFFTSDSIIRWWEQPDILEKSAHERRSRHPCLRPAWRGIITEARSLNHPSGGERHAIHHHHSHPRSGRRLFRLPLVHAQKCAASDARRARPRASGSEPKSDAPSAAARRSKLSALLDDFNTLLTDIQRERQSYAKRERAFQRQIEAISHDLRTPRRSSSASSSCSSETMLLPSCTDPELAETVAILEQKTETMKNLVSQFYDYSRHGR